MHKVLWSFPLVVPLSSALLEVDFSSRDSIRAAAALKAQDVMGFYHGHEYGQTPGVLPQGGALGYFWWQAGALFGAMVDYFWYTADGRWNEVVCDSLVWQGGENRDYMPLNVSLTIGNDDQAFWAMSALLAAESNFQDPPASQPQWLALAQGVYNSQSRRLDDVCGGGLRWQVTPMNRGYNYKNAIANGAYFNMAARLARYTQEMAYADDARVTFAWMEQIGLVGEDYSVFDGAHTEYECADVNRARFSYNVAVLLQGAAFMWDLTKDPIWRRHVDGLLENLLSVFYRDDIAYEPVCEEGEGQQPCTMDMTMFKSFNLRWLASTVQLCPWTANRILPALRASAEAAVAQCTGGENGRMCGSKWWSAAALPSHRAEFDGVTGLGHEMAALSALMAVLLVEEEPAWDGDYTLASLPPPATQNTGGTSRGDPMAGGRNREEHKWREWEPLSLSNVYGAALFTVVWIVGMATMMVMMVIDVRAHNGGGSGRAPRWLVDDVESQAAASSDGLRRGCSGCGRVSSQTQTQSLVVPAPPAHPRILALQGRGEERGEGEGYQSTPLSRMQMRQ